MMPVTIVVGAQWGDEGKGKIVDFLAQHANVVVRFNGGNNAGHTIQNEFGDFVLHLIPAGIFNPDVSCIVERGVVIHPPSLLHEMNELAGRGISIENLKISPFAHLVMPWHIAREQEQESGVAIGTTMRGIGPCYQDKAGRHHAFRVCDLLYKNRFLKKLETVYRAKRKELRAESGRPALAPLEAFRKEYLACRERMLPHIADTSKLLRFAVGNGKHILLEGAQGTLLDIDYGSYPYVTSSHTTAVSACFLTGISPKDVTRIIGISKAYTTRVGEGPFPTEIKTPVGQKLRELGNEYGATTRRPRRCGWLDLPLLAYARGVNHLTELALTKSDILGMLQSIRLCTGHRTSDIRNLLDMFGLASVKPVYERFSGWGNLRGIQTGKELPEELQKYIGRIEKAAGVPVVLISTGSKREETITS